MKWQDLQVRLKDHIDGGPDQDALISALFDIAPELGGVTKSFPAAVAFMVKHLPECDFRIERRQADGVHIQLECIHRGLIFCRDHGPFAEDDTMAIGIVSCVVDIRSDLERAAEISLEDDWRP